MGTPETGLVDLTTARSINDIEDKLVRCEICGDKVPHRLPEELGEELWEESNRLHQEWTERTFGTNPEGTAS